FGRCVARRHRRRIAQHAGQHHPLDRRRAVDLAADGNAEPRSQRRTSARHRRVSLRTSMRNTPLSIFSRASDAVARITTLTWFMIILSAIIFCAVVGVMIAAILRNRRREAANVDLSEPADRFVVWGGAILPGLVLVAVFIVALGAMRQ